MLGDDFTSVAINICSLGLVTASTFLRPAAVKPHLTFFAALFRHAGRLLHFVCGVIVGWNHVSLNSTKYFSPPFKIWWVAVPFFSLWIPTFAFLEYHLETMKSAVSKHRREDKRTALTKQKKNLQTEWHNHLSFCLKDFEYIQLWPNCELG